MRTLPARTTARLLPCFLGVLLLLSACSTGPTTATNAALTSSTATPTAAATPPSAPTAQPTTVARATPGTPAGAPSAKPTTAAQSPTRGTPSASAGSTAATPRSTPGTAGAAAPDSATAQALQAVIQQANDAQQRAFTAQDPTPMRDTATGAYYAEMVQTNQDLIDGGVTAIALVTLEWGPITQQGTTRAQVTTFETWSTTYADGTSDQARERNVYTLVQDGGAWKIAADTHPDAPGGLPTLSDPSGSGTGGVMPLPAAQTDPGQSSNWSGDAATGGTFTAVSGTWTVPQVSATSGSGADAAWVGIGGVASRDLIQAGTEATVTGGRVRYDAWIETLPRAAQQITLVVNPGDSISVAITQQTNGTWLIDFQNHTTGQRYQATETYTSALSSAEWVEEAPSSGRQVVPLDDFGAVQFGAATAVKDGQTVSIAQAGGTAITMIDRTGQALATPSALGGDGASFSVQRAAVAPTTPAPSTPRRGRPTTPGTHVAP
jgi:hypothetical protein